VRVERTVLTTLFMLRVPVALLHRPSLSNAMVRTARKNKHADLQSVLQPPSPDDVVESTGALPLQREPSPSDGVSFFIKYYRRYARFRKMRATLLSYSQRVHTCRSANPRYIKHTSLEPDIR
jgi:hypothetical protein